MKFTAETSAFADAVQKASIVSPSRGHAFDAAAGIVVECDPLNIERPVTVKATDLQSTFLTTLPGTEVSGDGVWRLPASVLAGFMSQLPMGAGESVTLESDPDDTSKIMLSAGRTKARLHTIDPLSFPRYSAYDPDGMATVDHFAQRVKQVAWSVAKEDGLLGGVHVDGQHLTACNRVTTAMVPCVVPVDEPITVPLFALAGVMKNTAEVKMRATERRLFLMTDEDTQASTVIFEGDYPDLSRITNLVVDYDKSASVPVDALTTSLQRMMVLCKSERYPLVKLTFHKGSLTIEMDVPDLGAIDDVIDIDGADHEPLEIWFTPTIITQALGVTKVPKVTLTYDSPLRPLTISDGSGYQCIAMPRNVS